MKSILVVDDDKQNRFLIRVFLQRLGYSVLEAEDGLQALRLLKTQRPDLIILDAMMPNMDGFTALKTIREDPATRDIPVIILTALDETCPGCESLANSLLTKPVDLSILRKKIELLLNKG